MRDISLVLGPSTPVWPGDVPFSCGWTRRVANDSGINLSSMTGSPHIGTHADAPLHVNAGAPATESLDLEAFLGPAVVVDVTGQTDGTLALRANDRRLHGAQRVLLRTGCSASLGTFPSSWPALDMGEAALMIANGVRLIGVDAPSMDLVDSTAMLVHKTIFGLNGYVLENLDLRGVPEGRYELVALPMRIEGADAAPVRAILR